YAEGSRNVGRWLLTGGVRLDGWATWNGRLLEANRFTGVPTLDQHPPDRSGVVPTARAGVRRDFDRAVLDGFYVRGAAYAGSRPPTLNALYRPFRVVNDVTLANPALIPERLYGIEAGAGQDTEHWSWSATVFQNRLANAVTNVTLAHGPGTFPGAGFIPAG